MHSISIKSSLIQPQLSFTFFFPTTVLCNQGRGGSAFVPPGRWEGADGLVVARETVNTRFGENQAELAVLVLPVLLKVLADGDSLLDTVESQSGGSSLIFLCELKLGLQHVQVLRDFWGKPVEILSVSHDQQEAILYCAAHSKSIIPRDMCLEPMRYKSSYFLAEYPKSYQALSRQTRSLLETILSVIRG